MNIDEALKHAEWLAEVALPAQGGLTNLGSGFVALAEEIERLRAENAGLIVKNEQLYKDRYDALSVHTKEGMLASEWLLRTGKAERRVKELEAENAELRQHIAALRADGWIPKPGAGT